MRINRVSSISFRSSAENNRGTKTKITDPYLYLVDTNAKKSKQIKASNVPWLVGSLALAAVGATLWRLSRGRFVPESVVELTDKSIGLNRIKGFDKNVQELKSKVLYPIIATMKGDKSFFQNERITKGILISSNGNTKVVKEVYDAFYQHAEKLGIKCIRMPMEDPKVYNINCKHPQMKWTQSKRIKWVNEAIEEAKEYYKTTNEFVIIFFGDFAKLTKMKINKGKNISKIEEKLASINKEKYPGIVWAGWTDKQTSVPLYLSDMKSLISKLTPDVV